MNYAHFFKYSILFFVVFGICEQPLDAMTLRSKTVLGTKKSTKPKRSKKQQKDEKKDEKKEEHVVNPTHAVYDRFLWHLDGKDSENAESISKSDCYNLLAHVSGQLFLTFYIAMQTNFSSSLWFRPDEDDIYEKCRTLYNKEYSRNRQRRVPSLSLVIKYDLLRMFQKVDQQLCVNPENLSMQQAQAVMAEALCVMHEALVKIHKPAYLYDYNVDDNGEENKDEDIDEDEQKLIGGVWNNPIALDIRPRAREAYRSFIKFIRLYEEDQAIDQHDLNVDSITPMIFVIRDILVKILDPDFGGGIYRFGRSKQPAKFVEKNDYLFKSIYKLDQENYDLFVGGLNGLVSRNFAARADQGHDQETSREIYRNTIHAFSKAHVTLACVGTTLPGYIDEDSYRPQDQNALLTDTSKNVVSWALTSDQTGELVTPLLDRGVNIRIQEIQEVLEEPLPELQAVRKIIFDRIRRSAIVDAMNNSIVQNPEMIDHMLQQMIDFVPQQEELFDFIARLVNCAGPYVQAILNSPNDAIRAKIHPAMKRSENDPVTLFGRTVENIIARNKCKVDTKDCENQHVYIDANMQTFFLNNDVKYVPSRDNKRFETMSIEDAKNEMWKTLQDAGSYRCDCLTHPNYIDCFLVNALPAGKLLDYLQNLYGKFGMTMGQFFVHGETAHEAVSMAKTCQDRGVSVLKSLIEQIKEQNKLFVQDEQAVKNEHANQFADSVHSDDGKDAAGNHDLRHDLIDSLYQQNILQEEMATRDGFLLSLVMKMSGMPDPEDAVQPQTLLEFHQELIAELQEECETSGSHYIWSILKAVRDTVQQRAEQIGYRNYGA